MSFHLHNSKVVISRGCRWFHLRRPVEKDQASFSDWFNRTFQVSPLKLSHACFSVLRPNWRRQHLLSRRFNRGDQTSQHKAAVELQSPNRGEPGPFTQAQRDALFTCWTTILVLFLSSSILFRSLFFFCSCFSILFSPSTLFILPI